MGLNGNREFIRDFVELEEVPGQPHSLRPKDKILDERVRQAYVQHLRRLADAWIDTGRRDDIESPRERNLRDFDRKCYRDIEKWHAENRPYLGFDESGETTVIMPWVNLDIRSPSATAHAEAVNLFSRFLDSDYRTRLLKCRMCETYFYSKREPRAVIKNGPYCDKHRHVASAMRSNARKRAPERSRKLELAAHWWGRWPKRLAGEGRQAEWVAEKVNRGLDKRHTPIKRNWITRNRVEIARQAKGNDHAKG